MSRDAGQLADAHESCSLANDVTGKLSGAREAWSFTQNLDSQFFELQDLASIGLLGDNFLRRRLRHVCVSLMHLWTWL